MPSYLLKAVVAVSCFAFIPCRCGNPDADVNLADLPYLMANASYVKTLSFDVKNNSMPQGEMLNYLDARADDDSYQLLNSSGATYMCGVVESMDVIPVNLRNLRFEITASVNYLTTNSEHAWFGFMITNETLRFDCNNVAFADLIGFVFWQKLLPNGPIYGVYQNATMPSYSVPGPTTVISEADCNDLLGDSGTAEYSLVYQLVNDSVSVYMHMTSTSTSHTCISDFPVDGLGELIASGNAYYSLIGMKAESGNIRVLSVRVFSLLPSDPTTTLPPSTAAATTPGVPAGGNAQNQQDSNENSSNSNENSNENDDGNNGNNSTNNNNNGVEYSSSPSFLSDPDKYALVMPAIFALFGKQFLQI